MTHRVLVVDDDDDLRWTVCELLQDAGYDPIGASDGQAALEELRKRPNGCCLVLLDLMMPTMDGWEFRAAQMKDPEIAGVPVVVMTAGRNLDLNPISAADILYKPIGLDRLLEAVSRYCQRSATTKP